MFAEAVNEADDILMFRKRDGLALYLKGLGQLQQADTLGALDLFERALETALAKEDK
jgi:hypothetical protein